MITLGQLVAGSGAREAVARAWLEGIKAAMALHEIDTPRRMAAFLSQMGHESCGFSRLSESFNYTPEALLATFNSPKVTRFTKTDAYRYGRTSEHPADEQMIACIAYGSRMGNGPMETGDGWTYRGRGPGMVTGKGNFAACGAALGVDLLSSPVLLERPDIGSMSFAWFWVEGNPEGINLNTLADAGDIDGLSDVVNIGRRTGKYGDANGFADRRRLYEKALEVLA